MVEAQGDVAIISGVGMDELGMFFTLGSVVPMTTLVVTLLTLQWEVDSATVSAREDGRGIVLFTSVLSLMFLFATGALNRLVSRSIICQ